MLHLTHVEPCGYGLRLLHFDAPLDGHTLPGQFTTATLPDGRRSFFALANRPGRPVQLLVKLQGEVAEAIAATPVGGGVSLSPAMGRGFGLPEEPGPLLLLVAGSGLSAVRPLVAELLDAPKPPPMTLLMGAFTLDHLPFADDLEAWARHGVDVRYVLGTPPPGWHGAHGFVQQVAREQGLYNPDGRIVVCGFGEMVDEVKRDAAAHGLAPDQVHTNY